MHTFKKCIALVFHLLKEKLGLLVSIFSCAHHQVKCLTLGLMVKNLRHCYQRLCRYVEHRVCLLTTWPTALMPHPSLRCCLKKHHPLYQSLSSRSRPRHRKSERKIVSVSPLSCLLNLIKAIHEANYAWESNIVASDN